MVLGEEGVIVVVEALPCSRGDECCVVDDAIGAAAVLLVLLGDNKRLTVVHGWFFGRYDVRMSPLRIH